MLKNILFLTVTLISLTAYAHQPDLSGTMLTEREDGSYILQVRAAMTGFEYEVKAHFGESSYPTPEKFQELAIAHLKENISIVFNENHRAVLTNAFVKLGHETNTVFELRDVPENISSITITNSSFKDISRNQSALIILKDGFSKEQFILNNENGHRMKVMLKNSKIIPVVESQSPITSTSIIVISSSLILVCFLFNRRFNTARLKNRPS